MAAPGGDASAAKTNELREPWPGLSAEGGRLLGALAVLLALALVVAFALASYFHVDVTASLSFFGVDEWCRRLGEGLGQHCFGDYTGIRFADMTQAPTGPEGPYPLASRLVRLPFVAAESAAGPQAGLILFLSASALCLLLPGIWAVRQAPWSVRAVAVTVSCIATMPFLAVMDRGNLISLAVPFLFLFSLGLMRDRPRLAAVAVVCASMVKPQFGLLVVAFLALRQWRAFFVSALGVAAAFLLPFLIIGDGWLEGVRSWFAASQEWSGRESLAADWPTNISFVRAVYGWTSWLMEGLRGIGLLEVDGGPSGSSIELFSSVVGLAMAGGVVMVLVWRGSSLPRLMLSAALLSVASMSLPVSFAYYSAFVLPVAALILREGMPRGTGPRDSRWTVVALFIAVVLSLTPLLLPGPWAVAQMEGRGYIISSLTPLLATTAWVGFLVLASSQAIRRQGHGARPGAITT